jgi:PAS domain S-box-containing protein
MDRLASLASWSTKHRFWLVVGSWSIVLASLFGLGDGLAWAWLVPPVLVMGWVYGGLAGTASGLAAGAVGVVLPGLTELLDGPSGHLGLAVASTLVLLGCLVGALRWAVDRVTSEFAGRGQAFEELEKSEQRYRSLHEGLPVGVYRSTPDGRILDANRALAQMLGYETAEELMELNARDLYVDPTERTRTQGSPDTGEVRTGVEVRLRHRDGSTVWVRDSSRACYNEEGDVLYFDGILENITEQRRSQRAQFAADERFRRAFEKSPIGMALTSLDGKLQRVNEAFCELLGYAEDELVGTTVAEITHPEDRAESASVMRLLAAAELPSFRLNKRYLHRDGHTVWVLLNASLVLDPDGEPEQFLAQIVDMTEREEAQRALEELVRSKDAFVATVSHELRTPLTAVHGFAAELLDRWAEFDESEALELLEMIKSQSAEVANLVEDLLVSARAEIGKLVVVPKTIDMAAEAQATVDLLPERVRQRVADISGSAAAKADPGRLRQIIRNLLTNAERYGGEAIRVVVETTEGLARLRVQDDGAGIPASHRESIFEPYQRAHGAVGQPAGVGLGLTVSRQLARLMDGDLTYRYADGWSTFELTLPSAHYHAPAERAAVDVTSR